jgi:heat shock protein HslJ
MADSAGTQRNLRWRWLGALLVGLVALAGCIPPGAHTVSSFGAGGISPGLWRTLGGTPSCLWFRRAPGGGIIAAGLSSGGPRYVQVLSTDGEFDQYNCVTFWGQPGPFSKALHNASDPLAPFGPGDWLVGFEVAPGWYAAPGASSSGTCSWERVSNFQHMSSDIISQQHVVGVGPQLVKINSSDTGFTSDGCGSWLRVFVPAPQPALAGSWRLTSVRASASSSFVAPNPSTLILATFAANQLSGGNDCNGYTVPFVANGGLLALGAVNSGSVVCHPGDPASAVYVAALPNAVAYVLTSTTLTLLDGNGSSLVVYTAIP